MHAAEHDNALIRLRRRAGKLERVASNVSDVLDLGTLIIMCEDDSVQVFFELQDFIANSGDVCLISRHT